MTDKAMDVAELTHARDALGMTDDVLAATLGLPPAVVRAWARGDGAVPAYYARTIRWNAAVAERQAVVEASGLPACGWMAAFETEPAPTALKKRVKRLEQAEAHVKTCATCLAREEYAAAHGPPLPEPPLPEWMKLLGSVLSLQRRLPPWAAPAVPVSVAFGAYSLFRIFFWLPRILQDPRVGLVALAGLALSMSIGAALGLLYGVVRHFWSRLRRAEAPGEPLPPPSEMR